MMIEIPDEAAGILLALLGDEEALARAQSAPEPNANPDDLETLLSGLGVDEMPAEPKEHELAATRGGPTRDEKAAARMSRCKDVMQYRRRREPLPPQHCSEREMRLAVRVSERTGCGFSEALRRLRS